MLQPNELVKSKASGFTLVELLVVLSIMALLVALLLPALSKAKTSAHIIKCASNERQQGIAMAAYTTDFKGYFVNPWSVEKSVSISTTNKTGRNNEVPFGVLLHDYLPAPTGTWTAQGQTYVGLSRSHLNNAWTCPSPRPGWLMPGRTMVSGGTYSINGYLFSFLSTPWDGTSKESYNYYPFRHDNILKYTLQHESRARRPSTTISMEEGVIGDFKSPKVDATTFTYMSWGPAIRASGTNANFTSPFKTNKGVPYHGNFGNQLFIDGHVKGWDITPIVEHPAGKSWTNPYLIDLRSMSEGSDAPKGYLIP